MHIADEKEAIRRRVKERISDMSDTDRRAESRTLCKEAVRILPPGPLTCCGYIPLTDEADIRPLLATLLERGDELYLPCFESGKLTFRRALNLDDLHKGQFGILEPPYDADSLDPALLDIAFIPGRAFDVHGYRLGRGNGGYDKWIRPLRAVNPKAKFYGIALECQLTRDPLPVEAHDEPMDGIMTARGLVTPKPAR